MLTNTGLYILTSPCLEFLKTKKFGMSMRLDQRWFDYTSVFSNPKYLFCYEFITNNSKEEIFYIEQILLEKTKDKQSNLFSSEYRNFTEDEFNQFHNEIITILNEYNIQYILHKNPIFETPKINYKPEPLNNNIINTYDKLNELFNLSYEQKQRNKIQSIYVNTCVEELENNFKCLMVAPTGFGKTHMIYKIINKLSNINLIVLFTPRLLLNSQSHAERYIKSLNKEFDIIDFSKLSNEKKKIFHRTKFEKSTIIISCYQSANQLYQNFNICKNKIDLCIFDEAHIISSWNLDEKEFHKYWLNSQYIKYRLITTATPKQDMINLPVIFGNVVEKVKIYDLINLNILCNIKTVGKKVIKNNNEYHEIPKLIEESMIKYNKKKGVIYVNTQENAKILYKLMNEKTKLKTFIFISENDFELNNEEDKYITEYEKYTNPCVIINCQKISYGYDNDLIDFICFADPRQSDISIRQICGRGLRWNKKTYPNKLLHILLPIFVDEFGKCTDYDNIKSYLDYIIGECGQDIINSSTGKYSLESKGENKMIVPQYTGDEIPPEICEQYCTTGHNMYSKFIWFLKVNKVINEKSYNELQDKYKWMPILSNIRERYKKFCFRDIDDNRNQYYATKEECSKAIEEATNILKKNIGMEKYKKLMEKDIIIQINKIDNKIPLNKYGLYYC